MKVLAYFTMVMAILFFSMSCDEGDENDIPPAELFPSLKVENEAEEVFPIFGIYRVSLAGYDFENLMIPIGDTQTFVLDKGMPEGYEEIEVEISFGTIGMDFSAVKAINFEKGKTRTIILKGCEIAEGCNGFYLE